jgi:hypothetical protein
VIFCGWMTLDRLRLGATSLETVAKTEDPRYERNASNDPEWLSPRAVRREKNMRRSRVFISVLGALDRFTKIHKCMHMTVFRNGTVVPTSLSLASC